MIPKHLRQKASLGLVSLAAIALGAVGCVKGTVTPELGYHQPTSQRFQEFDSSTTYGIRGGVEFDNGLEVEVAYDGHETVYENAIQRNDIEASDLGVRVSVPLWKRAGQKLAAFLGLGKRKQKETMTWVGPTITEDTTADVLGVGVSYEKDLGKGALGAELEAINVGEGSYEESGWKAKIFYKVKIGPVKRK